MLPIPLAMRLMVFSDDWGRHPSSCQHLVRELLPRYRTLWVNTVGMRRVRPCWNDLQRGVEWACSGKKSQPQPQASDATPTTAGPDIASPWMWPGFGRRWQRRINAVTIRRAMTRWANSDDDDVVGVTTLPIVADLVGRTPAAVPGGWVYYCVDDFNVWPGVDGKVVADMERELLAKVDRVVAVSDVLCDKMRKLGRDDVQLLTHGVAIDQWQMPACNNNNNNNNNCGNVALFWGLLDERLDVACCCALGAALRERGGKLVLVGPGHVDGLDGAPGVELRPPVSHAQLPQLAAAARVLVMPYRDLPVTQAMQPLKFKEYLATGLPVVGRALPGVAEWCDAADLVDNPAAFVQQVLRRMDHGMDATQQQARQRLAHESWTAKAAAFEEILLGCVQSTRT